MADDRPTATGHAEINSLFEQAFAAMRMKREVHVDSIAQTDQVAIVRTHSTGTVTLLELGTTIEQTFRELYGLRHTGNGWRISDDIVNSMS